MTNADYTHLTLVVDRSGSMSSVRGEAQGGINALVAEQFALPGRLTVTLSQFDNEVESVQRMSSAPFTYDLEPRGMTALLDAVGLEVVRTGADLAALPEDERPGRVLLVVVTDGHENSSHEYTIERVRSMLGTQKEQYGWEVRFLGADDAAWQGEALGVATTRYANTAAGNDAVFAAMSGSMATYRTAPVGQALHMPEDIEAR
ncbi:VWA domain-containing protein [Oryzobacter terrae]|uniref:VWA domain-containing protein n=1 Tax=Oryzobacter terrae TaxID=1620385 RepID=UPI00367206EC